MTSSMLALGRALGAFPFILKKDKFVLSQFWLIYSLVGWFFQLMYAANKVRKVLTTKDVKIYFAILSVGHDGFYIFVELVCILAVWRNLHHLNEFYRTINQGRRLLKNLKVPKKRMHSNKLIWFLLAYVAVTYVAKFLVRKYKLTHYIGTLKEMAAILCHLGVLGAISVFACFVTMIDEKLQALNEFLIACRKHRPFTGQGEKLVLDSDVHYLLSSAADQLDMVFRKVYFLLVCCTAWSQTSSIIRTSFNFWVSTDYKEALFQVMWIIFWFIVVFATVLPCSSATAQSKKFNRELALILIHGYNFKERYQKDKLQLHVDYDFTVSFNCGFFEVDRSLIQAIQANVASFAVILAQIAFMQGQ